MLLQSDEEDAAPAQPPRPAAPIPPDAADVPAPPARWLERPTPDGAEAPRSAVSILLLPSDHPVDIRVVSVPRVLVIHGEVAVPREHHVTDRESNPGRPPRLAAPRCARATPRRAPR